MLSGTAFEVYEFAVAHPGWTKETMSTALGYTIRDLNIAIGELVSRQLLQQPAPDVECYVAISPDVALSQLVDSDERLLIDLRTKISGHRADMAALVPTYLAARKRVSLDSSVEVLEDPGVIRKLLVDYGRDVSEQVLISQPGSGASADVHEEGIQKDIELLNRGVVRKNISHASTLDHVPTRKAVAAISPAGGEYRTLPYVPLKIMIFDRNLALIGRQLHPEDRGALVVRDFNLIQVFINLFHVAWELADPYVLDGQENGASDLNGIQHSILNAMAAGYSDEVIARRLDISVRTCRRHIAWMLEQLGAESRFQAALKARDAGWL
jgi:DNA-binding CsgD family transcriptional regulator